MRMSPCFDPGTGFGFHLTASPMRNLNASIASFNASALLQLIRMAMCSGVGFGMEPQGKSTASSKRNGSGQINLILARAGPFEVSLIGQ